MSSKVTFQVCSYITWQSQVPPSRTTSTPHLTLSHWKPDNSGNKTITGTVHPISSNRTWKSWTRSIATQRRDVFQRFFTPAAVAPHLTIRSVADPFQKFMSDEELLMYLTPKALQLVHACKKVLFWYHPIMITVFDDFKGIVQISSWSYQDISRLKTAWSSSSSQQSSISNINTLILAYHYESQHPMDKQRHRNERHTHWRWMMTLLYKNVAHPFIP